MASLDELRSEHQRLLREGERLRLRLDEHAELARRRAIRMLSAIVAVAAYSFTWSHVAPWGAELTRFLVGLVVSAAIMLASWDELEAHDG